MSESKFVHLRLHSCYSVLEGLQYPDKYVEKAAEQGMTAVGITDKASMAGAIDFYKACRKNGLKAVLGCQVYIAFNKLTDKRHQIDNKRTECVLLAETREGYENLLKMLSTAWLDGYYYKPRVDWDLMRKHSKGLIALSGGLGGDIPQAIINGDDDRVKEMIQRFQDIYGKENFYFEMQHHPLISQQQLVNDRLKELSKEYNVPLVATGAAHYVNPEDNEAHDIQLCIGMARNLDDAGRFSMMNSDYSMRTPDQFIEAFKDTPEAIENTVKIADRCAVDFEFDKYLIPVFPTPENKKPEDYLRELCYKGLIEKYHLDESKFVNRNGKLESEDEEIRALVDRLDYELKIIIDMGFVGYFLIVWDFVKWSKDNGIIVGPGRGSAAGALVSYTLDITTIDPLKYSLLFERFLNPARISMPDIDLDFADNRRDEVIDYVAEKYGRDRVAQICTFGTLAARAAVKDVGRVLGVPFVEMNDFAKLIPEKPGTKLTEALEQSPELKEAVDSSDVFGRVMDNALKLEGVIRHVSVHACAVVIAPEPLSRYTALQHPPKDDTGIITQFSAKPLEALGLLKMDFLGLKNLTILQKTLNIIERTKGEKINLQEIPIDDKKAYALMARGETTGVFQLESAGMKRYLKELKPTEFEDIIAMVSLYRPGPMEWIPDYIQGKHGRKQPVYLHPSLEPILKTTYGIAIYQEQILQIAQEFGGFSLGEADLLRRAIGKKIASELEAQREKFIQGAADKGHKESLAVMIFEKVIEPFAGYGFNKSHAACYAMIAYQTAYLKARYPTEFMTALMTADSGNTDRIVIEIGECDQMGIKVLPPDVNESLANFTYVEDGKIRFGLSAIKGLGDASVQKIIEARQDGKFENLADFARRCPAKIMNKKTVEALAFSGAMGEMGERKQLGVSFESLADFSKKAQATHQKDQAGLFDHLDDEEIQDDLQLEDVEPATDSEKLKWEKEYLGLYVSSHPLAGLKQYFKKKVIPTAQLPSKTVGKPVKIGGMISFFKKLTTKKGDMMAILEIEDPYGKVAAVMFPKSYKKYGELLQDDQLVFASGKLDKRMGEMQVMIDEARGMKLEDLQKVAEKEGLWNPNETIEQVSRQSVEDEEVADAEEVLQVSDSDVKELGSGAIDQSRLQNGAHQILLNREVDKTFFVSLKKLFEKHPGSDRIELVIGERVIPVPNGVALTPELKGEIDALITSK